MGLFKKVGTLLGKKKEPLFSKETKLLNKVFEILYTKETDVEFEDIHEFIGNSEDFHELTQLHFITQLALKADSEISELSFAQEMHKAYEGLKKTLTGQYKLETILKWTEEYTSICMTDFKIRLIQYQAAYKSNQYSYKGNKYAMMKVHKRPLTDEQNNFCLKTAAEIEIADNRLREISNIINAKEKNE